MLSKNNFLKNFDILKEHFLFQFFFSISIVFFAISYFSHDENLIFLYAGYVVLTATTLSWLMSTKTTNTKHLLLAVCSPLFVASTFILIINSFNFLPYLDNESIQIFFELLAIFSGSYVLVFKLEQYKNSPLIRGKTYKFKILNVSIPLTDVLCWLSFIVIITIALSLRLYNLDFLGLWWDEQLTGTYVSRILETGLPLSPSGYEYYWRGIAYHYFVSFFTTLFGNTEFWLRFPSVLFGTGIIALTYILTARISRTLAICAILIICFSSYNIEYSQFARFYAMNAFLFLLGIEFFWQGFFKNRKIYRYLSYFIFIIMLLTVQLGGIFLAVVAYWGLYQIYQKLIHKISIKELIIKKIPILLIFISIYFINNPFDFLGVYTENPYDMYSIGTAVDSNINFILPGIPYPNFSNVLIPFFNEHYWPSFLLIITYVYVLWSAISKIKKKVSLGYTEYLFGSFFLSYILFELANPFTNEPRLYFIFEPIFVISSLFSIFLFTKYLLTSATAQKFVFFFTALMLLLTLTPNFTEPLLRNYGDDVSTNPFRTTWAQSYRSDSKTTLLYLKNEIKEDDIWINTMEPNYFYLPRNPDYIVNQNYKWKSMWREELFTNQDRAYIDIRYDSIIINDSADLERIVTINNNKNVWLVVNGANLNTLYTQHLNSSFSTFLKENNKNTVFTSEDKISSVLLFPAH